jgi:hypothetical protein
VNKRRNAAAVRISDSNYDALWIKTAKDDIAVISGANRSGHAKARAGFNCVP